jgi:hypothetical protein
MLIAWAILSIVLVFGVLAFMSVLRAVMKARQREPEPFFNADFAMADLHDMLNKGQITADEFEQLKQSVLLRAQVREALLRESEMNQQPGGAYGFRVIQNPPPLPPPAPPAPPLTPASPDESSRDAR